MTWTLTDSPTRTMEQWLALVLREGFRSAYWSRNRLLTIQQVEKNDRGDLVAVLATVADDPRQRRVTVNDLERALDRLEDGDTVTPAQVGTVPLADQMWLLAYARNHLAPGEPAPEWWDLLTDHITRRYGPCSAGAESGAWGDAAALLLEASVLAAQPSDSLAPVEESPPLAS